MVGRPTADVAREEEGEEGRIRSPGVVVAVAMARVTPLGKSSSEYVSPPTMIRACIINHFTHLAHARP